MKFKSLIAAVLTTVIGMNSCVFAASINSVSKNQTVKNWTSLASGSIIIEPLSEITTGDSIVITFKNATVFSQDVIDGSSRAKSTEIGYSSSGYQYRVNGTVWNDPQWGFYDVMKYIDEPEMPYYINRLSDEEIEVRLCNIPSKYAGQSMWDINGSDKAPFYSIPIVAYSDSEVPATISAVINSNGTSITGGDVLSSGTKVGATTVSTTTTVTTTTEAQTETTTAAVSSNKSDTSVNVQIGRESVIVGGDTVYDIDVAPYIQTDSSSTMVPLRAVCAALSGDTDLSGSKVAQWDADNKLVTITYGGKVIKFAVGSDRIEVDGESSVMDYGVVTEIKDSRAFVPFRALGEALGVDVEWLPDTKTALYK